MGGDSWSIGCEFESLYQLLDGSFLTTPTVASLDVIIGMLRKQNLLLSHWHHHHQVLFCLSNDLVAIHGCCCCEQEEFIALPNLKQPILFCHLRSWEGNHFHNDINIFQGQIQHFYKFPTLSTQMAFATVTNAHGTIPQPTTWRSPSCCILTSIESTLTLT